MAWVHRVNGLGLLLLALGGSAFAQDSASDCLRVQNPDGSGYCVRPTVQWRVEQQWFCPPVGNGAASPTSPPAPPLDPPTFIQGMLDSMNYLGRSGAELVSFNQMTIAGVTCFVATFKNAR